jgi:hypothetical protein
MFRLPRAGIKSTFRSLSSYGKVDETIVSLISGVVGPENVTTSESGTLSVMYIFCKNGLKNFMERNLLLPKFLKSGNAF